MFFSLPLCPPGYRITHLLGFVEELVTKEDPDFERMAMLRSTRTANEKRQTLLYSCSNILKREVGRQVLLRHGNAVLGMRIDFDIEEDSGLVCRGYGTACVLALAGGSPLNISQVTITTTR